MHQLNRDKSHQWHRLSEMFRMPMELQAPPTFLGMAYVALKVSDHLVALSMVYATTYVYEMCVEMDWSC